MIASKPGMSGDWKDATHLQVSASDGSGYSLPREAQDIGLNLTAMGK